MNNQVREQAIIDLVEMVRGMTEPGMVVMQEGTRNRLRTLCEMIMPAPAATTHTLVGLGGNVEFCEICKAPKPNLVIQEDNFLDIMTVCQSHVPKGVKLGESFKIQ